MKYFALLVALFLLPIVSLAQSTPNQPAFKAMIETEQAFSKMAEVKTAREAFMAFIADDGLLFRPGAVNGKKWMNENPVPTPPEGKKPLLAWQPSFGGIAAAGDLGFSTGPWEFKADSKDEKPAGYGHFVTLWKKQSDNTWKFVIDLGISHPTSGGPQAIWKVETKGEPIVGAFFDVARSTRELLKREGEFSGEAVKQGVVAAFKSFASEGVRLYVPNNLPFVGKDASLKALSGMKGGMSWSPIAADVSRSGDLGYTHGSYEKSSADDRKKTVEKGSYVHIWQKIDGEWKVVLSITNITPN